MGACLSLDVNERKAKVHSEQLDKYLQDCAKEDSNIIKILLLGECKLGLLINSICIYIWNRFCTTYGHFFAAVILSSVRAVLDQAEGSDGHKTIIVNRCSSNKV